MLYNGIVESVRSLSKLGVSGRELGLVTKTLSLKTFEEKEKVGNEIIAQIKMDVHLIQK